MRKVALALSYYSFRAIDYYLNLKASRAAVRQVGRNTGEKALPVLRLRLTSAAEAPPPRVGGNHLVILLVCPQTLSLSFFFFSCQSFALVRRWPRSSRRTGSFCRFQLYSRSFFWLRIRDEERINGRS